MECVEKAISNAFAVYGRFLGRHPAPFLITSILVSVLLGIEMLKMESERDIEALYTPVDSQALKDREKTQQFFTVKTSSDFYAYKMTKPGYFGEVIFRNHDEGVHCINPETLDHISDVVAGVLNLSVPHEGSHFKYRDVCALRAGACVIAGGVLLSPDFKTDYAAGNVSFPIYKDRTGQPHDLTSIVGDPIVDDGRLVSFHALRLIFFLRQDNAEDRARALLWEDAFLHLLESHDGAPVDFAYQTSQSMMKELDKTTPEEIIWICLSFILMTTYVTVVADGGDCLTSRGHLARAGIMATGLAVVAAFGLLALCGLKFVSIVGVAPFLAIGKGIDDMFILLAALRETWVDKHLSPDQRVGEMFRKAGSSITVTTLTDLVAFSVSATSSYRSIQHFCIYTGLTLLFCYFNMVFMFGACVAIHCERIKARLHHWTCQPIQIPEPGMEHRKCYMYCCTGKPPGKMGQDDGLCERAPGNWLPKVILNKFSKLVIILLFGAYLGVAIWGAAQMKEGLDMKNLAAQDSYWRKYSNWNDQYFTGRGPIVQIVITQPLEYWKTSVQKSLDNIISDLHHSEYVISDFSLSWVKEYQQFLRQVPSYDGSKAQYMKYLRQMFLPGADNFRSDMVFNQDNSSIVSSRIYIQGTGGSDTAFQSRMMLAIREIVGSSHIPALAFCAQFVYYEQYVTILSQTLETCGIALGVMFLLGLIFIPHPLSVVYVITNMVMILVGMFGFMHFWGLTLSFITMIQIILSIAFCIDFSAHMCHAFMKANDKCKTVRATIALRKVGVPILNSATSSILGIVFLVFAESYIFQTFFKTMFLVVVLGVLHALLLLPLILSVIGPPTIHKITPETTQVTAVSRGQIRTVQSGMTPVSN